jgi:CRP-like cAMP-binding protein/predicted MFS family arabinose efflux permease
VLTNPDLRRLELAWGGFYVGDWAHVIALSVYAYRHGGSLAVGVVGLLRMLPSAFAVPFASLLSDRLPRQRVLVLVHAVRALALGAGAAVIAGGGPPAAVYAAASVAALAATPFRPAHWALLPALARTPGELVAANVSSSTIESVGALLGPALGGLALALWSPAAAFVLSAALFVGAAALVLRVGADEGRKRLAAGAGILRAALAGFRALRADAHTRLLIALFVAQTFVRGLLNVLVVVTALELLGLGDSGVGLLNSAFGAGGLVGAFAALGLVARRRLAYPFAAGLVLWGAPIALIGVWPHEWVALLCLALVGGGNSVLDVAGFTLVQRMVDDAVLARVFGVLETGAYAGVGLGAILAPALVAVAGIRGALIATGLLLPSLALACWRTLGRINERVVVPERELALLRRLPIFAPLPPAAIERLAMKLVPAHRAPGEVVVRKGETGDRFYVVAAGELEVAPNGSATRSLTSGDAFGEIALLRDVPRTATVTALTDAELYALDRDAFVSAVTGSSASARAADELIDSRLELSGTAGTARPRGRRARPRSSRPARGRRAQSP